MKAIEITAPGKPEVLRLVERPTPAAGAGRAADPRRRVGHQPARRAAAEGPLPGAAGRLGHPRPRGRGNDRRRRSRGAARPPASRSATRVCALVAGGGYAEFCVAPVGQCLPTPGQAERRRGGQPARDLLHRLVERLRSRAACSRARRCSSTAASSGIGVTAIQHGARRGARRVIATVGSRREGGGVPRARRRPRDRLQDAGLRRRGAAPDRRHGRRRRPRHGRGRATSARERRAASPRTVASSSSRCRAAPNATVDAGLVLRRRLTITGSTLRPRPVAFKARSPRR